jgi:hypothetical protein
MFDNARIPSVIPFISIRKRKGGKSEIRIKGKMEKSVSRDVENEDGSGY